MIINWHFESPTVIVSVRHQLKGIFAIIRIRCQIQTACYSMELEIATNYHCLVPSYTGRDTEMRILYAYNPWYEHNFNFSAIVIISPNAAYMNQWTWSTLVQVMDCRLFGAKPLPKPMLAYCQLNRWEQTSGKFESNYTTFHFLQGKTSLVNGQAPLLYFVLL